MITNVIGTNVRVGVVGVSRDTQHNYLMLHQDKGVIK